MIFIYIQVSLINTNNIQTKNNDTLLEKECSTWISAVCFLFGRCGSVLISFD